METAKPASFDEHGPDAEGWARVLQMTRDLELTLGKRAIDVAPNNLVGGEPSLDTLSDKMFPIPILGKADSATLVASVATPKVMSVEEAPRRVDYQPKALAPTATLGANQEPAPR